MAPPVKAGTGKSWQKSFDDEELDSSLAAELKKAADPEAKQAKAKQASLELAWTISKVG